jgi:hypothetical protein
MCEGRCKTGPGDLVQSFQRSPIWAVRPFCSIGILHVRTGNGVGVLDVEDVSHAATQSSEAGLDAARKMTIVMFDHGHI